MSPPPGSSPGRTPSSFLINPSRGRERLHLHSHPSGPGDNQAEMTVKLDFEECLKDSPRFR